MAKESALVLLIEDDPGDQELTRRALGNSVPGDALHIISDGEKALRYLENVGDAAQADASAIPDLILLDLNMPKIDGREILQFIRAHKRLRLVPVVVLSTSKHELDVTDSYELGCNTFISKPVAVENFMSTIRQVGEYWLGVASTPVSIAKRFV